MSKEGRKLIQQIFRDNFPRPGDAASTRVTEEQFFQRLASDAVNVNDGRNRDLMKHYATEYLLNGRVMTESMRAWLIYVLNEADDLPHAGKHSKGRPIDGMAETRATFSLAIFLADRHAGVCPNKLSAVDQDAAGYALGMSASKVRKLFDSEGFKFVADEFY